MQTTNIKNVLSQAIKARRLPVMLKKIQRRHIGMIGKPTKDLSPNTGGRLE